MLQSELKGDSIQSRIFRCVGNLAALPTAASDFHDIGFVPVLVEIVKPSESNQNSSETIQMAIRALRYEEISCLYFILFCIYITSLSYIFLKLYLQSIR